MLRLSSRICFKFQRVHNEKIVKPILAAYTRGSETSLRNISSGPACCSRGGRRRGSAERPAREGKSDALDARPLVYAVEVLYTIRHFDGRAIQPCRLYHVCKYPSNQLQHGASRYTLGRVYISSV